MLTVTRQILVSAPKESVKLYLGDLARMAEYEKKIEKVELNGSAVDVQGRFLGLKWRGSMTPEITADGGYRGEMFAGPLSRMTLGYHLRAVPGGTIITHEEQYQFSLPLRPFAFAFRNWVTQSMDKELGVIKEGAEALNRQIQLKKIESIS